MAIKVVVEAIEANLAIQSRSQPQEKNPELLNCDSCSQNSAKLLIQPSNIGH